MSLVGGTLPMDYKYYTTNNIFTNGTTAWDTDLLTTSSNDDFQYFIDILSEPTLPDLIDEGLELARECLKKKQYDLFDRVSDCVEKMIMLSQKRN